MGRHDTCPLPDDPSLAAIARALNDAGYWAIIVDPHWRSLYMTDAQRVSEAGMVALAPFPVGVHLYSSESLDALLAGRGRLNNIELMRERFEAGGGYVLAATQGGREELRELVDRRLHDIVDRLSPVELVDAESMLTPGYGSGMSVEIQITLVPVRSSDGKLIGTVILSKPAPSMAVLAAMAAGGDLGTDGCVVDLGGLVGRHVGDGAVAFFLADTVGSESAAARACIQAARDIRSAMTEVAARSDLAPADLLMRFGLHWGATLYVGQITTRARAEVTALGDEVNEGARIEACATGGRTLASKDLLERLRGEDAAALDLDPARLGYTQLAELPTATEKARRDAPSIAVCEV